MYLLPPPLLCSRQKRPTPSSQSSAMQTVSLLRWVASAILRREGQHSPVFEFWQSARCAATDFRAFPDTRFIFPPRFTVPSGKDVYRTAFLVE